MASLYPQALFGKRLANNFRNEEILNASLDKLMLKTYDYTIIACKKKDRDKAADGLVELISSLNLEYEEQASGLLSLYRYCLNNLRAEGFDQVADILNELKETWGEALNN